VTWAATQAALRATAVAQLGAFCTWTAAKTGTTTTVTAVYFEAVEVLNEDTGQYEARDLLRVQQGDVPQPRQGDRVTVAGKDYLVDRYQLDAGLWRIWLKRRYGP
jgi:hypothetical protein